MMEAMSHGDIVDTDFDVDFISVFADDGGDDDENDDDEDDEDEDEEDDDPPAA
jgi:hypothetical protein